MKYSDVLRRSMRAMKSPVIWGFAGLGALALLACFGAAALLVSLVDAGDIAGLLGPAGSAEGLAFAAAFLRLYATLGLGSIPALFVFIFVYSGFISLSDAVLAGRPTTLAETFGAAARGYGRLFGIEALLYLAYLFAVFVIAIPLIASIVGGAVLTGDSESPAGIIGGMCIGYLWFFLAVLVTVVVYSGVESLSSRYGLIGGRTAFDALSAGWKAFRLRWKNVAVFSLIVIALTYAWSFLTSMVTSPLMLFAMPFNMFSAAEPSPAQLGGMMDAMLWLYGVTALVMIPAYVFIGVAWTAFFRQLTGLDVAAPSPAAPPYSGPAPYGTAAYPYPEQPPKPPQAPDAPAAPPAPPGSQPPAPPAGVSS